MYEIKYTKKAADEIKYLKAAGLDKKAKSLIELLKESPYQTPPPCEKMLGDMQGAFSRRINIKHRLVYQVFDDERIVKILSMWTHYDI